MRGLNDRDPYHVGIAGGVALAVFLLALGAVSTLTFGQNHYVAQLEHTAGLRVGESVEVAGVGVGEVLGISLGEGVVDVEFSLDDDIQLGSRTTATVKVATFLGTHFLQVAPAGSGELQDATIPVDRTSVPFNLQDVINAAGRTLEQFDESKVSKSLEVVADAMRGTPEAAREALEGVSALSRLAADRSEQMRTLLSSSNKVTSQLADNSEQIIALLRDSNLIFDELTSRREVINQLLADSEKLADAISGVIKDNEEEFEPLMRDLTTTLELLRDNQAAIAASIDGFATTARYFANATGNGPWLDLHVPIPLPDNVTCVSPNRDCR